MKTELPVEDIFSDNELEPKLSKKRIRVFAGLIDVSLTAIVGVILAFAFGDKIQSVDGGVGYRLTGPLALIPLFFWILMVPILEAISGQSLAKMIFKIKVLSIDFSKPHSIVILRELEIW